MTGVLVGGVDWRTIWRVLTGVRTIGRVVASFSNATNIPYQRMQLRLHFCNLMPAGGSFNSTFQSFSNPTAEAAHLQ